jgi:6-phosphofructokinase
MQDLIPGNAVIGQSGGPTAVINQSLVGIIEGLRSGLHSAGIIKKIYGMKHGVRGLIAGDLYDFTDTHQDRLDRLAATPSACLGSTRDKPDAEGCQKILAACEKHNIRYFFYIGGNDSCETCRIVSKIADEEEYDLRCFHVPKTIDNDLVENDHCPGYPSAARFVAMACMADFLDNISLPGIKINVIMGRNAGFLTAASALARRHDWAEPLLSTDGPQLIYLPEVPFDMDRFVADVESIHARKNRCHLVVSEGIRDKHGKEIGPQLMKGAQIDAHGNVQLSGTGALGDALAEYIKQKLTPAGGKSPRVRADTFGYVQRCWPDPSPIDVREARRCGRYAAQLAIAGKTSGSITIKRCGRSTEEEPAATVRERSGDQTYISDFGCVELSAVAAKTRIMPPEFIAGHNNVSRAFLEYCRPLVGELPGFERL